MRRGSFALVGLLLGLSVVPFLVAGGARAAAPTPSPPSAVAAASRTSRQDVDTADGSLPATTEIVVATKRIEPFVFVSELDGSVSGYSIDLWDEIASRLGVASRFDVHAKVSEIIDQVSSGSAEVGIAAISMTPAREAVVEFSHPYYNSGLQVMVRNEGSGTWGTVVAKLTSRQIVYPVLAFLLLIVLIAHAVWLFERRDNEDFPPGYVKGVWEGLFWSVVTVTTGGDAEKRLKHVGGRVVGMVWMLFGLFVVAYLTASVASALTIAELRTGIEGFADLNGVDVVTVEGTVADAYLNETTTSHRTVATIEEAEAELIGNRADAVVYDAPVLAYFEANAGRNHVHLVGDIEKADFYGIAMHQNSTYREQINVILLELKSDGFLDDLSRKWFE